MSKKEEIEEDIIVDFDDKWSSLCFIDMEEQFEIDQRPTTEEFFNTTLLFVHWVDWSIWFVIGVDE